MFCMAPAQSRAARALLQWSPDEHAHMAGTNAVTVRSVENGKSSAQRASISAMGHALEKAGVVFLEKSQRIMSGVGL